jgi:hypothetical protein
MDCLPHKAGVSNRLLHDSDLTEGLSRCPAILPLLQRNDSEFHPFKNAPARQAEFRKPRRRWL